MKHYPITLLIIFSLLTISHATKIPHSVQIQIENACELKKATTTHGNRTICQCIFYRIYDDIGEIQLEKQINALEKQNLSPADMHDREFLETISPLYKKAGKMCYPL